MLGLANTSEGKDLLRIRDYGLPIIGIRKNAVLYDQGGGQLMAEFRVGASWGNLVRSRWQEVRSALEQINELQTLGRSQLYRGYPVPAGAASLTVVPDAHPESTTMDAYAGATYDLNTAWNTVRTEGGGNSDDSAVEIAVYTACNSSGSGNWANMSIGFFLFDTSPLTASAVISAATVSFAFRLKSDEFAQAGSIALVQTTTASNTSIANSDYGSGPFSRVGTASDITIASIATNGTRSTFTMNSTGEGNISKTGVTKLGVQTSHFTDNSEPTWLASKRHSVTIRTAEYGSSLESTLIVTYTVAFTPKVIIF